MAHTFTENKKDNLGGNLYTSRRDFFTLAGWHSYQQLGSIPLN